MTRPVSATPACARSDDEECDPADITSAVTPTAAVSNRLFCMTRLLGVALVTLLLLLEKREGMTDALVSIGSSDVVRVASNDDEPRVGNLHLVSPCFLHRMHFGAVRGDDERGRADPLQDSLFGEIKFRHRLAETFYSLSIRPAEERVPVFDHLSRRVRTQPVALWNW